MSTARSVVLLSPWYRQIGDGRRWEATVMVSAYHSSNRSDPDVYHDHNDCPTGEQIPPRNKVSGTGGYPR